LELTKKFDNNQIKTKTAKSRNKLGTNQGLGRRREPTKDFQRTRRECQI